MRVSADERRPTIGMRTGGMSVDCEAETEAEAWVAIVGSGFERVVKKGKGKEPKRV
jgi:hypothetical protein